MDRFARRFAGRTWTGFRAPDGFVHAADGAALEPLTGVRAALAERFDAAAYEHVLATQQDGRQVVGARALDDRGRCVAWLLLVELDGALPALRLTPQGFGLAGDPEVGDQAFDRMYRIEAETPDDTWPRQFCSIAVRQLLTTHRALDVTVVDAHLLHVRTGATSPDEAVAAFGREGALLVALADLLPAELYAAYGTTPAAPGAAPDLAVEPGDVAPVPDAAGWPLLGSGQEAAAPRWPLLPPAERPGTMRSRQEN